VSSEAPQPLSLCPKDAEYLEAIVRKAYDVEADRKEKLLSNMNAIVAALVGITAGLNFTLNKLFSASGGLVILAWVIFFISLIFIIRSFWIVMKLVSGAGYKQIQDAVEIVDDAAAFRAHFSGASGYTDEQIKSGMRNNLIPTIADAAAHNCRVNNERVGMRVRLYRSLAISAALISALFFVETLAEHVQKVGGFENVGRQTPAAHITKPAPAASTPATPPSEATR